jgi:hypothetical protein
MTWSFVSSPFLPKKATVNSPRVRTGDFQDRADEADIGRGKTEPQQIYAVVGRLDDPDCPENLDAVRKMVGWPTGPEPLRFFYSKRVKKLF